MPIGKSKISDMDFGSFENMIDKNIETDKASDRFDRQLQAYNDACAQLNSTKNSVENIMASFDDTVTKLNTAICNVNATVKTLDEFLVKVRAVKLETKIAAPDLKKLSEYQRQINADVAKLLEGHKREVKERLTNHFYEMSNKMSRNNGVWLSNGWVKTLLWIFLPCTVFTIILIVYSAVYCLDK